MHEVLALAILFLTNGSGPKCVDTDALAYAVEFEADQNGVDPFIVLSIIANESEFNACAVSADGKDFGLMQLRLTGAGKGLKRKLLLDPFINVHVGVAYFATQQQSCQTFVVALRAYNAGSCKSAIQHRRSWPYSKHILRRYFSMSRLLTSASSPGPAAKTLHRSRSRAHHAPSSGGHRAHAGCAGGTAGGSGDRA